MRARGEPGPTTSVGDVSRGDAVMRRTGDATHPTAVAVVLAGQTGLAHAVMDSGDCIAYEKEDLWPNSMHVKVLMEHGLSVYALVTLLFAVALATGLASSERRTSWAILLPWLVYVALGGAVLWGHSALYGHVPRAWRSPAETSDVSAFLLATLLMGARAARTNDWRMPTLRILRLGKAVALFMVLGVLGLLWEPLVPPEYCDCYCCA